MTKIFSLGNLTSRSLLATFVSSIPIHRRENPLVQRSNSPVSFVDTNNLLKATYQKSKVVRNHFLFIFHGHDRPFETKQNSHVLKSLLSTFKIEITRTFLNFNHFCSYSISDLECDEHPDGAAALTSCSVGAASSVCDDHFASALANINLVSVNLRLFLKNCRCFTFFTINSSSDYSPHHT